MGRPVAEPRLIQVTGKNQNGKSTLVRELLEKMRAERVIIVQPFSKNDYEAKPYAKILHFAQAYRDVRPARFRVKFMLDNEADLEELCRLAWAIAPVTLVLDETAMYLPNPSKVPKSFKYICQLGAHAGPDEGSRVSVIAIGQRPTNLPTVFRAEADDLYTFRLKREADRDTLVEDFGMPPEQADAAGKLPPYHYIKMDNFGNVSHGQTTKD